MSFWSSLRNLFVIDWLWRNRTHGTGHRHVDPTPPPFGTGYYDDDIADTYPYEADFLYFDEADDTVDDLLDDF